MSGHYRQVGIMQIGDMMYCPICKAEWKAELRENPFYRRKNGVGVYWKYVLGYRLCPNKCYCDRSIVDYVDGQRVFKSVTVNGLTGEQGQPEYNTKKII